MFLVNVSLLAHGTTAATRKIAVGQLQAEIRNQLQQNYYVNLSVAMTMAPDAETYNALMQSINQVLSAENDDEAQWFALPIGKTIAVYAVTKIYFTTENRSAKVSLVLVSGLV